MQKIVYLVLIHIFLSITLRKGGKCTINTATRCLLRIIELQPAGECLFEFLVESSFFLHTTSARQPSVVLETVLLLSFVVILYLLFPLHKFSAASFSWNYNPRISVSDLYNKQVHDANEPLAKDIFRLCPDLPIQRKPG